MIAVPPEPQSTPSDKPTGGLYLLLLFLWLGAALAVGAVGFVEKLRPPLPQFVLFALVVALLLAFWRGAMFRAWILALPPRALVLLHTTRFVGFYFLSLHSRGELPYAFAVPGGWGDIAIATLAMIVSVVSAETKTGRRAYLAWNIVGLLDILFVVATAARLAFANPDSMIALLRLPLSLLPTFLVPLILATHIMLFVRLSATQNERTKP